MHLGFSPQRKLRDGTKPVHDLAERLARMAKETKEAAE
jgi:hypothetical protein